MSTLVQVMAPCACRTCAKGKKVTSQRGAAEHIGMTAKDFRAACRNGNGPVVFDPTERTRPRYAITQLDAWVHGRDDRKASAA